VASYIVLGVVVSKFVLKREGKEIFPNYSFWTSLPGYSKVGVIVGFTCIFTGVR